MILNLHPVSAFIASSLLLLVSNGFLVAEEPQWTGKGRYRIMVEIPPVRDLGRCEDEMVAKAELDLHRLFPDSPADHRIVLHSLQVIRQDSHAMPYPKHVQQQSADDRPFRFYDHGLLDEFPTWRRYASDVSDDRATAVRPSRVRSGW